MVFCMAWGKLVFTCQFLNVFMFQCRSAQAAGGAEAHGGVAQSRDAEEEGDADQVFIPILQCP